MTLEIIEFADLFNAYAFFIFGFKVAKLAGLLSTYFI
jgi:hypothetical protein